MLRRLTRQLTFLNSAESNRFNSFTGSPHLRHFPVKSLPVKYPVVSPTFSSICVKCKSSSSYSAVTGRRMPVEMSSSPMTASVVEDFVHVDEEVANLNSEGSEASVVEEQGIEEVISANVEGEGEGYERKVLPEELSRSVMMLTCDSSANGGICDVYVVGTAHVSSESCQEVEAVINFLKPEVVFLELCSGRVGILTPQNLKVPTMGEMVEMWKKNQNPFGILYSWFLAKVATKLEVFPGAEFRVAYEEAMKYGGKVILGDRPVQVTLRRTWAKMPLWHKTKLVYSLLFQAVFLPKPEDLVKMLKDMDDVDMLTLVIQEMSKQFPTLMDTLVHERDQFMSSMLIKVAREHSSVVAVVGKGHLPGIKKNWKQPIEVKELLSIPSPKPLISVAKIVTTLGVAVAGVAIISGIYVSSKK
ncbi:traB domain-containing protein [Solanum tuberosum]|uniref:traB domain-containing protein n=1 Tax=Solanum tuberosum TaxID=4113 RepID=UPI00073A2A28|nr:PREDICTED: traB domain-containing protein [Solanum tuberosum]KAH0707794.1 hypothetical protein KY289_012870 [Solanum tuberosum]